MMIAALKKTIFLPILAFLLSPPAGAADKIGNCDVDGPVLTSGFTPAIPGQLTVEVSLPGPVWWNGDTPDSIKDGYEYCLAAYIAHRLGVNKVQPVNVSWDAMMSGRTRNFDLALNEISITPERAKVIDFSPPYYHSNIGVLVKTGTKFDSASLKTARIGIQQATTGATFVDQVLKPSTPPRVYADEAELFTALASGQVDAVLTDVAESLGAVAQARGRLSVIGQYDTGEVYGAAYPKNSTNKPILDKVIASLVADGTTDRLAALYLGAKWDAGKIPFFTP
jgi:polar amino acid transport system substrate-binding protein